MSTSFPQKHCGFPSPEVRDVGGHSSIVRTKARHRCSSRLPPNSPGPVCPPDTRWKTRCPVGGNTPKHPLCTAPLGADGCPQQAQQHAPAPSGTRAGRRDATAPRPLRNAWLLSLASDPGQTTDNSTCFQSKSERNTFQQKTARASAARNGASAGTATEPRDGRSRPRLGSADRPEGAACGPVLRAGGHGEWLRENVNSVQHDRPLSRGLRAVRSERRLMGITSPGGGTFVFSFQRWGPETSGGDTIGPGFRGQYVGDPVFRPWRSGSTAGIPNAGRREHRLSDCGQIAPPSGPCLHECDSRGA